MLITERCNESLLVTSYVVSQIVTRKGSLRSWLADDRAMAQANLAMTHLANGDLDTTLANADAAINSTESEQCVPPCLDELCGPTSAWSGSRCATRVVHSMSGIAC